MPKQLGRYLLLAVLVLLVSLFFLFDLDKFLDIKVLKEKQAAFNAFYQAYPVLTLGVYALACIIHSSLPLPGLTVFSVLAGALFGFPVGVVLASFATTIGGTFALFISRMILQDLISARFKHQLSTIQQGFQREGALYLLTIRLLPVFPFYLVNMAMGLIKMRTTTFFIVSQLGMLPLIAALVYAGTELAKIQALGDILSINLLIAFSFIAFLPLILKSIVNLIHVKRCENNGCRTNGMT